MLQSPLGEQPAAGTGSPSMHPTEGLPGSTPDLELGVAGGGVAAAATLPELQAPPGSQPRPPSTLLKSVLKSALKGGGGGRGAARTAEGAGSPTAPASSGSVGAAGQGLGGRASQASQGSGSSKKVSVCVWWGGL